MTIGTYLRLTLVGFVLLLVALVCAPFMVTAAWWHKHDLTYRLWEKPSEKVLLWFVWRLPRRVVYWCAMRVACSTKADYPLERPIIEALDEFTPKRKFWDMREARWVEYPAV